MQRIHEAGNVPADHRDYWTLKRLIVNFVLVGVLIGPLLILGMASAAVFFYMVFTGGLPPVR